MLSDQHALFLSRSRIVPEGAASNLTASILAGLSACMASNPVDVIRTRLMVQRRYLVSFIYPKLFSVESFRYIVEKKTLTLTPLPPNKHLPLLLL